MSYEKQTWQTGDIITADKLNHIEDGLEDCCGGGDILTIKMERSASDFRDTTVPFVCDTSIADINAALRAGQVVMANVVHKNNTPGLEEIACVWSAPISFVMGQFMGTLDMYAWAGFKEYFISHPPVGSGDDLNGWTLIANANT